MFELAARGGALVPAALGFALLLLLIAVLRVHAFLSLTVAALVTGVLARGALEPALASYAKGFGETAASVGLLIALGAVLARLLADAGVTEVLVERLLGRVSARGVPWAMAAVSALIGLPMFFEVGLLLLMPLIVLVASRSGLPLLRVGMPALAALSAMHGLVPPHPGPLVALQTLGADLGLTLALGISLALPAIALAGPGLLRVTRADQRITAARVPEADMKRPRPSFAWALTLVLMPVALMMLRAAAELAPLPVTMRALLADAGRPVCALLIPLLLALVSLSAGPGGARSAVEQALPATASILLIVAAGGGFKQTLIDCGLAQVAAQTLRDTALSPLLLGWLLALAVRVATGSATVATITASGVLVGVAAQLGSVDRALLVLAIGSGSLFFSHVNDAGFWLVKECFGLSLQDTVRTWSLLESVLSVTGLLLALALQLAT